MPNDKFYVGILKDKESRIKGASISWDPDSVLMDQSKSQSSDPPIPHAASAYGFENVIDDFVTNMIGMHSLIPFVMYVSTSYENFLIQSQIESTAQKKGRQLQVISDATVFEIDERYHPEFRDAFDKLDSLQAFNKLAPGIFLTGLISHFDAYLGKLLREIFLEIPQLIDASNVQITFSDLVKLGSVDAAREAIVQKEVEAVIRESHVKHFEWLETKLKMPLRKDLPSWPQFVEVCERRNLWTHNGGIASQQYLDVCVRHEADVQGVKIGDRLPISSNYMKSSTDTVFEIGVKLGHTIWRKLKSDQLEAADFDLNDIGFRLIKERRYKLAIEILRFGANQKKHSSDLVRRMMVINLANATKLAGEVKEALEIVNAEDWSAVDDRFQICLSVIRDDFNDVLELMNRIGPSGSVTASDYRNWPIFREIKKRADFRENYEKIFGHPLEGESREIDTSLAVSEERQLSADISE